MANPMGETEIRSIALVGQFLPRPTAAAMPTTMVCNALAGAFCDVDSQWVAISDEMGKYAYPSRVRVEVQQGNAESFASAAEYLNLTEVDVVCYFHEFDHFDDSETIVSAFPALLRGLHAPVVSCLSAVPTVDAAPVRQAVSLLAQFSICLIVSSTVDGETLRQAYGIPEGKIRVIEPPQAAGIPAPDAPEWRVLARQYMACFLQAHHTFVQLAVADAAQLPFAAHPVGAGTIPVTGAVVFGPHDHALPILKLDHFLRLSDETGILKGAVLSLPDYQQGYSTLDNARALMFSLLLEHVGEGPFIPTQMQISRHLAFLYSAFNAERGIFRETMDYTRAWRDDAGSEECHGLAVWALGMTLDRSRNQGAQGVALRLFEAAIPAVKQFSSLRAWAFSLLGIHAYLHRYPGDRAARRTGKLLLDRLVQMYNSNASEDWPWFEEALGAGSICVSQALIASSEWAGEPSLAKLGIKTLNWLADLQFQGDHFVPIGDQGYYRKGGRRARYAQRPVEARGMISACLDAYRVTGDDRWLHHARGAFEWFMGRNDLGRPLYDTETGGCCDALLPGRLDHNFGAEALLSFLLAQLEMRLFDQIYYQKRLTSPQLPILQIGSPSHLIQPEENHFSGVE